MNRIPLENHSSKRPVNKETSLLSKVASEVNDAVQEYKLLQEGKPHEYCRKVWRRQGKEEGQEEFMLSCLRRVPRLKQMMEIGSTFY